MHSSSSSHENHWKNKGSESEDNLRTQHDSYTTSSQITATSAIDTSVDTTKPPQPKSIQLLNATLISQIAAGEVVDRPAAVVRELIDNSIDSGANTVVIDIRRGGLSEIRVIDNGSGIAKEQLCLALSHHATSKVASFADLQQCTTLGFRGEALASMNSVARVFLASRQTGNANGYGYCDGWEQPRAQAMDFGTKVQVDDLFYQVPARRKFLKSETAEWRHIFLTVKRIALVHFLCAFRLTHNHREVFSLPIVNELAEKEQRIAQLLGKEFIQNAIHIDAQSGSLRLRGWLALPSFSRSRGDMQFLYVNNRPVRDSTIAHAINQGYRDTIYHQRYPAYLLMVEMDPQSVDHNVHPAKQEIRMRSATVVHDFVANAIAGCIAKTTQPKIADLDTLVDRSTSATHAPTTVSALPQSYWKENSRTNVSKQNGHSSYPRTVGNNDRRDWQTPFTAELPMHSQLLESLSSAQLHTAPQTTHESLSDYRTNEQQTEQHPLGYAIGLLHNIYLLAQNTKGLLIVDVHAAHERILYEQLKTAYRKKNISIQQLMFPESVEMPEEDANWFMQIQQTCADLGLQFSREGPRHIRVNATPAKIGNIDVSGLMHQLLSVHNAPNFAETAHIAIEDHFLARIANCACRSAIKAGYELSMSEMNALLRDIERTDRNGQCNHGRPTWVQINTSRLDSLFMRGK